MKYFSNLFGAIISLLVLYSGALPGWCGICLYIYFAIGLLIQVFVLISTCFLYMLHSSKYNDNKLTYSETKKYIDSIQPLVEKIKNNKSVHILGVIQSLTFTTLFFITGLYYFAILNVIGLIVYLITIDCLFRSFDTFSQFLKDSKKKVLKL